ncbi:methylmalonyl-CoA epimerase [Devosia yakushimensis]|uniref:Methylmalonyl-CoA epimerase n=1 Tax=Devosia yakushimensis TaxID=470028 RepID=A0ABQ5UAE7_9HYPH|nr:methylmalonyl-CoA epimerase [Devosia yakushimensis]GLQ08933.1 methylmalonyl-CoA epimerase [Devosia yakushimensis]
MIGRLNHIAIAVPDLAAAAAKYRDQLGAQAGPVQALPEHGVSVVFIDTGNTKVELLEPLGEGSPIGGFLAKNPGGGMHHICFEVPDLAAAVGVLTSGGARMLGEAKIGAHGRPVVFLHPKDFDGTLIELEEVAPVRHPL